MMMILMMMITIIIIIIILIDVAIPADRNVVQREAEKKLKYQEFMYTDTTNVEPEM